MGYTFLKRINIDRQTTRKNSGSTTFLCLPCCLSNMECAWSLACLTLLSQSSFRCRAGRKAVLLWL